MPPFVAPWIVPVDALAAARAGSAAGDAQAQLGLSREQLAQSAEQHAAELALQRDDMMARAQEQGRVLQAGQQQQSAADALRQQAINQQGVLGQGRIGVEEQGVDQRANAASAADQLRQQQIDNQMKDFQARLDASENKPNASDLVDVKREDGTTLKVPVQAYQAYTKAHDDWTKGKPTQHWYGTTSDQTGTEPSILDFVGNGKYATKPTTSSIAPPSAASALTGQNAPAPSAQPVQGSVVSPEGTANPNATAPPTGFIGTPGGNNSFAQMPPGAQNGGPNAPPPAASALQPSPVNGQAGLPDFTGQPVGAGKPAAPQVTATNPKTGQKMALINGQWQPLTQQ